MHTQRLTFATPRLILCLVALSSTLACTGEPISGGSVQHVVNISTPEQHRILPPGDIQIEGGFNPPVDAIICIAPGGATVTALPRPVDRYACTLNVTTPGRTTLSVTATRDGATATAGVDILISGSSPQLAMFPPTIDLSMDRQDFNDTDFDVYTTPGLDPSTIAFNVAPPPVSGMDIRPAVSSGDGEVITVTDGSPQPGQYNHVITGSVAGASATIDHNVTVTGTPGQTYSLMVSTDGPGNVTSQPSGINCGITNINCTQVYAAGTSVTLTATTSTTFQGWQNCGGPGNPGANGMVCVVTMDMDRGVFAGFGP